jgi:hypothetical protein
VPLTGWSNTVKIISDPAVWTNTRRGRCSRNPAACLRRIRF